MPTNHSRASTTLARRALVVDDEPSLRMVLRRFLERRGWRVDEALDGAHALELLASGDAEPDAVIVDLNMPGMAGGELCGRIVAMYPHLADRLIIASGDGAAAHSAMTQEGICCPVLAKPFELTVLEETLDEMLVGGSEGRRVEGRSDSRMV